MRKWLFGCLVAPLVLCVICLGAGYFAGLPWVQDRVSNEVADTVEGKVARSMSSREVSRNRIVVNANELDINNTVFSSDVAINVTNDGTEISGFSTDITEDRIRVVGGDPDDLAYTAVPTVENGRIVLTDVEAGPGRWHIITLLLPEDAFASGLEDGINRALAAKGLRAVDVRLGDGTMTIETEAAGEAA